MRNLFQRNMNENELNIYKSIMIDIKNTTQKIIDDINLMIKKKETHILYDTRLFLDNSGLTLDEKFEYYKKLRDNISNMLKCETVRVRIAKPWHPMCWCYYLSKKFPKIEFFKNYIMFGFCVPFFPGRPIMLPEYLFNEPEFEIRNIIAHELTHSLMYTKDLNATNYKDAINDAWTICFLY